MDSRNQPSGYVDNMDDCNDTEPLAWTGAIEFVMASTTTVQTVSSTALIQLTGT